MPNYYIWKQVDEKINELVEKGLINAQRLELAREKQREKPHLTLCEIMIYAGFLDKEKLTAFIAEKLDIPVVDPLSNEIDPQVISCIPAYLARQYRLIPFKKNGDRLMIVMADPSNTAALEELMATYPETIEVCIGIDDRILQAVTNHYTVKNLSGPSLMPVTAVNYQSYDKQLDQIGTGENVVNIVNNLLVIALNERASDIHLDPMSSGLKVRFRIDGTVQEMESLDRSLQLAVISRVKVMAELDISEKRIPQDGRSRVQIGSKVVDLRIATYPTMWGEKASIRILTKNVSHSLEGLGFTTEDQNSIQRIIAQPHGLFLVTGPTGSGKTTTLYSAFMRINRLDKHAIAIEDPIENEIIGVNQAQVNVKAGVTFSAALRSMLRHDPDIILVGEIRDSETADITARAAMTGHLVFSTLHTNSAVGAINRLRDLGLPPYLIASSLIGIMGQRLVRKICAHCRTSYTPTEDEIKSTGGVIKNFFHGTGCENCRHSGYSGRTGIYEVIEIDNDMRDMIGKQLTEQETFERLKKTKFHTMWDDGLKKIDTGLTTVTEVLRACRVT